MESEERLARAALFLEEAVVRSRARQAAGTFLAQSASDVARQCGLGSRAEVELDLSARARELFDELWPAGADAATLERVQAVMRGWVEEQDAFDRERNHFLKAFRQRHGFDRNAYPAAVRAEFEGGLEAINAEVGRARNRAAGRLASESGAAG
jgi:hypothetical protein